MHSIDPNTALIAIAAFFNAVPSVIAAYYAFHARREAVKAKTSSQSNNTKLSRLEITTNGLTEQLVKATAEASYAKGLEEGKDK